MSDSGLTTHPARRNVLEFLRLIVLDALAFQAPNKVPIHIVDQLLEVSDFFINLLLNYTINNFFY